ncbi:hypothetical protein [Motilimonas eburnea]|uniref:hypothetical protein n=1 Tax=Motilimonas eburnea TaxID=1737488 RepID=UPI001E3C9CBB|nr:hypothetical protein [Motilimonas eburnea]MCE2570715.1 hypothetical protein [Motilimonas eburnea]
MEKERFPGNIYNYAKYFGDYDEVLDAILFLNENVVVNNGEDYKVFENDFEYFYKHGITMTEVSSRNFDSMVESLNKRLDNLKC